MGQDKWKLVEKVPIKGEIPVKNAPSGYGSSPSNLGKGLWSEANKPLIPVYDALKGVLPKEEMSGAMEGVSGVGLGGARLVQDLSTPVNAALGIGAGILGSRGYSGMVLTAGFSAQMLKQAYERFMETLNNQEEGLPREKVAGFTDAAGEALMAIMPWLKRSPGKVAELRGKWKLGSEASTPMGPEVPIRPSPLVREPWKVVGRTPLAQEPISAQVPGKPITESRLPLSAPPEMPEWMRKRQLRDEVAAQERAVQIPVERKIPDWQPMPERAPRPVGELGLTSEIPANVPGQIVPQEIPIAGRPPGPVGELGLKGEVPANVMGQITSVTPKPPGFQLQPLGEAPIQKRMLPKRAVREPSLLDVVKRLGIYDKTRRTEVRVSKNGKVTLVPRSKAANPENRPLLESGITTNEFNQVLRETGTLERDQLDLRLAEYGFEFNSPGEAWSALLDPKKRSMTAAQMQDPATRTGSVLEQFEAAMLEKNREIEALKAQLAEAGKRKPPEDLPEIDEDIEFGFGANKKPGWKGEEGFADMGDPLFDFMNKASKAVKSNRDRIKQEMLTKIALGGKASRSMLGLDKKKPASSGTNLFSKTELGKKLFEERP
jgi:hypothetical protein